MKNTWFLALFLILITACKTSQTGFDAKNENILDEIEVIGKKHPYRAAADRTNDLIHTKLNVSFDWNKQYLYGEAWLTLRPYFYPSNELVLDAKGMDILEVKTIDGLRDLTYTYDNLQITIDLGQVYTRDQEYGVYVQYISKPNEIEKAKGLEAIKDDKGLYFINPLGEDADKPMQIWTQGEPESNSVWFPTIDKPNERCSQEISMTVENRFLAMSNGVLMSDIDNGDGTHTVTWKQDKPHAPYLFMMTIGEFAQIKDEWNGMSVDYFVEAAYKDVAEEIFGETPAMLSFFVDILGVDYEWDKYWQVCVRDYVSGAMENTSAVIFGEFVQRNERELLDEDHEDIVSHELFHHWFGDLVTCESWANLPLNESFATYGEVLWREYRYGEDEKYRKIYDDMGSYFYEANSGKQVDMIRFYHDMPEDMFDSHSYAKGGVILNMLRDIVGDDAFFASLQLYLEDNKFQSVEIHNLRLAFEEVTGLDLNWFFNQWFLSAGHPVIDIDYLYTDSSVIVQMKQTPSVEDKLIYTLPLQVDIYTSNTMSSNSIQFDKKEQEFEFLIDGDVKWVNVDAQKSLLAEINDNQSDEQYIFQYKHGKNMLDKLYALEYFSTIENPEKDIVDIFQLALDDDYWYIQDYAAYHYPINERDQEGIDKLINLAENSPKSDVMASAILTLSLIDVPEFETIFVNGTNHPSYRVNAASLDALSYYNPDLALETAEKWEKEDINNYEIIDVIGYVYSELGGADKVPYFHKTALESSDEYDRIYAIYYYSMFLGNMSPNIALDGVDFIKKWGETDTGSYSVNVARSSLKRIKQAFEGLASAKEREMNSAGLSKSQKLAIENEMINYKHVAESASDAFNALQR